MMRIGILFCVVRGNVNMNKCPKCKSNNITQTMMVFDNKATCDDCLHVFMVDVVMKKLPAEKYIEFIQEKISEINMFRNVCTIQRKLSELHDDICTYLKE